MLGVGSEILCDFSFVALTLQGALVIISVKLGKIKKMSSIEKAREIMTDPIKLQELELNELLIQEQRNKWKTTLISFILGVITALGSVLLSSMLSGTGKPINAELLLNTVNNQVEVISTLTVENTNLKAVLKNLESSCDIKK